MPIATPIVTTRKKSVAASLKTNVPVVIAVKANLKTIRLDASFNKLSPSAMLTNDLGTFTFLMIDVAEMASGGDTIPPKRKPRASVKPGIHALETNAITQDVTITIGKAKLNITRLQRQNSFQEVFQAAA